MSAASSIERPLLPSGQLAGGWSGWHP